MRAALRKVRAQLFAGFALSLGFSLIVFLLERQELNAARQAAVDDQVQGIEQRIAIAAAELDAASAFVVQANPPVLLLDDFLGRLTLSTSRDAPWAMARVVKRSDLPAIEQQLRLELGNPKFAIDDSQNKPLAAPVIMTFGQMARLQPGKDAVAVPEIAAILDPLKSMEDVRSGTLLIAGSAATQDAATFYFARLLVHDDKAPGRMQGPTILVRGIQLPALRMAGGLQPRQHIELTTDIAGSDMPLASDLTNDDSGWSSTQPVEVGKQRLTINIAGYPDWPWPRFWLLALVAGVLATMLYGTARAGQLIKVRASSLDVALSTTERELAETQRREVAFFENAGTANCETDFRTGQLLRVNDSMCRMFGYGRDELLGRTFLDITSPDDREQSITMMTEAGGGPRPTVQFEKRYLKKDGTLMWALVNGKLYLSEAGEPVSYLTVIVDITARKRDEEVKVMLVRELAHRVRNTVQLTASLSRQSARRARSVADYEAKFHERLTALSAAQDLLFDTGWKAASIQRIAERTIKPFLPDGKQVDGVTIDLPPVDLPTQQAQTLAIGIHELASNSARFGALAHGGTLALTGKVLPVGEDGVAKLYFRWEEVMPRRLRRPRKSGFGMTMLQTAMPDQFQGTAEVHWQRNGLLYEAWLTLPARA